MLLAASCDGGDKSEKFPGFLPVKWDGKTTDYLYEKDSIVYEENNASSFKLIRKIKDGYILQNAYTDCIDKVATENGTFYSYSGGAPEEFEGSVSTNRFFSVQEEPQLRGVIKSVCKKEPQEPPQVKEESDTLSSDQKTLLNDTEKENPLVSSTKELEPEIKINKKSQTGFLTAETDANVLIGSDADTVKLTNGTQVKITGISDDGQWLEIDRDGSTLYVPSGNVAVFSD